MKVYLNYQDLLYGDAQLKFFKAAKWASEHCNSYYGLDIFDVVAEYRFYDEKDATLFALRWA